MAYICDDCKLIFPNKRTNCPFCGGRVYDNTLSEQQLLNSGYLLASEKLTRDNNNNQYDTHQHSPYDELRHAFLSNQSSSPSKDEIPEVSPQTPFNNTNDVSTPPGVDFFSQFSGDSNNGIDIPTVEPPLQTNQPEDQLQDDLYEQELQELERQRRRFERQYRRRAALHFITNLRWRTVLRIVFVVLLIIIAVSIWQMRYVIFNSLMSFLISLLPIFIVLWILWYIFRSFFR